MSQDIHVVGTLIPVTMVGTLEETAKALLENYGKDDSDESYADQLLDIWYDQYYIIEDQIYTIQDVEDVWDTEDIFNSSVNDNGSISFEVKFYDGGCSFSEALGYAVNK